jgi:hypothetical protein
MREEYSGTNYSQDSVCIGLDYVLSHSWRYALNDVRSLVSYSSLNGTTFLGGIFGKAHNAHSVGNFTFFRVCARSSARRVLATQAHASFRLCARVTMSTSFMCRKAGLFGIKSGMGPVNDANRSLSYSWVSGKYSEKRSRCWWVPRMKESKISCFPTIKFR